MNRVVVLDKLHANFSSISRVVLRSVRQAWGPKRLEYKCLHLRPADGPASRQQLQVDVTFHSCSGLYDLRPCAAGATTDREVGRIGPAESGTRCFKQCPLARSRAGLQQVYSEVHLCRGRHRPIIWRRLLLLAFPNSGLAQSLQGLQVDLRFRVPLQILADDTHWSQTTPSINKTNRS